MRTRPLFVLSSFGLMVLVAALARGQQPQVRSLFRDASAARSLTVSRASVSPLFGEEVPAGAAAWLASGDAESCHEEVSGWLAEHGGDEHAVEARFLVGYCAYEAGRHDLAFEALSEIVTSSPLLSDIAAYHAAMSAFELGRFEATVTLTLAIPDESVYAARSRFLRGRALRRSGRGLEAVGVLRGVVERYPSAWYIAQVKLELGRAQADLGDLEAAAEWYHHVAVRYPGSGEEETAQELLDELLPRIDSAVRERLTAMSDEDLLARSDVLFERHRSREVIDLLDGELARLGAESPVGCRAHYLVGKSYSKLRQHGNALPFYEAVVAGQCEEDLVVWSLYNAGRSLWNIDRDSEAAQRFRQLYTDHAGHSYADDAMLYEARIERSNGNEASYLQLLEAQIRQFPDGDMLGDANWLLFERDFSARNDGQAIAFADAVATHTGETDLYNRGRIAYFRARALERSGRSSDAADGYAAVATDVPLSYYALMAINRLGLIDAARSEALVASLHASSGAADTGLVVEPAEVATNRHFESGMLLLRLGLLDLARQQLEALKDDFPNQENLLWLVAYLFDAAGAYHLSHDIPRRQIASFLGSYPTDDTLEQWHLAYPTPFGDEVAEAAEERGLDRFLVYAIMREESGFNPRAESWANARGLMQLMEGTADSMAERVGRRGFRRQHIFRPEVAIQLGSEYLRVLADRYSQHPVLTIAGYNGGQGNVDRWVRENGHLPIDLFVEEIPYKQTRDYAKRVLMTYWIYTWLYGDEPLLAVPFQVPQPG